jgi:hypothetical protein
MTNSDLNLIEHIIDTAFVASIVVVFVFVAIANKKER